MDQRECGPRHASEAMRRSRVGLAPTTGIPRDPWGCFRQNPQFSPAQRPPATQGIVAAPSSNPIGSAASGRSSMFKASARWLPSGTVRRIMSSESSRMPVPRTLVAEACCALLGFSVAIAAADGPPRPHEHRRSRAARSMLPTGTWMAMAWGTAPINSVHRWLWRAEGPQHTLQRQSDRSSGLVACWPIEVKLKPGDVA
jgi:hypothetical protein